MVHRGGIKEAREVAGKIDFLENTYGMTAFQLRSAVLLSEGRSVREIAKETGRPEGSVRHALGYMLKRVHRAERDAPVSFAGMRERVRGR